jgi:hypothetical protein
VRRAPSRCRQGAVKGQNYHLAYHGPNAPYLRAGRYEPGHPQLCMFRHEDLSPVVVELRSPVSASRAGMIDLYASRQAKGVAFEATPIRGSGVLPWLQAAGSGSGW